ncbi:MAG: NAD(P)/FAD-dependent oxidoreductase [Thermoplasmatales archaeon]|nr:NAD(P)/FAD-dependent oxidoreductase [Thermoplasmatales archaeon]
MDNSYDVVVVGAGPAGLASAKSCAENGLKTLLIEEHPAIGTPVQCGETFHVSMLKELGLEDIPFNEPKNARIYSPNRKMIEIVLQDGVSSPLVIVERKILEKSFAVKVANLGVNSATERFSYEISRRNPMSQSLVDIFTKTPAVDVIKENGFVKGVKVLHFGEEKDIISKVVIDASGPNAFVARKAGLNVYRNIESFDSCAQFQMAGINIDGKTAEIYLGGVAPGGYVWILPKGKGFANVGIGVSGNIGNKALGYLESFVENDPRLKDGSIIETNVGIVPVGGEAEKLVSNGLILVGDAGRMVNPATGGGMVFAIKAGLSAGKVVADAVKNNNFSEKKLSEYEKIWRNDIGKKFKAFNALKNVFLSLSDKEIDDIVKAVGKIQIDKDMTEPWYPMLKKIVSIIVKKPRLALKFGKVLPYFV